MGAAPRPVVLALLILLVIASAFAIVASTHQSRAYYALLQDHEARRWHLEEEYSRLLIEQSTWASHQRIAAEASASLGLSAPDREHTRLVTP